MRQRLISVYKLNVLVRLELKPTSLVELTLAVGPASSEASGKRLGHDKNLRLAAGVSSGNCIPSMRRHRGKPAVAPTILVNTSVSLGTSLDRLISLAGVFFKMVFIRRG